MHKSQVNSQINESSPFSFIVGFLETDDILRTSGSSDKPLDNFR